MNTSKYKKKSQKKNKQQKHKNIRWTIKTKRKAIESLSPKTSKRRNTNSNKKKTKDEKTPNTRKILNAYARNKLSTRTISMEGMSYTGYSTPPSITPPALPKKTHKATTCTTERQ
ncbi:hypothetical protein ACJMK2_013557 [Sinanodonta woodiana]|uniref:Uncharacterized protein n=1 Tax=Sinanodonta woodiana TaxID=1069815 RepID=A0ABD3V0Y1_SINWO